MKTKTVYAVSNVKGDPRGYGRLSFEILEDGAAIAKVKRGGMDGRYIAGLKFRFYTSRAEGRFLDFCGESDTVSTCEALLSYAKVKP